ncbi:hypothetical protein OQA88_9488 [Cercophora sp. LCS_1]
MSTNFAVMANSFGWRLRNPNRTAFQRIKIPTPDPLFDETCLQPRLSESLTYADTFSDEETNFFSNMNEYKKVLHLTSWCIDADPDMDPSLHHLVEELHRKWFVVVGDFGTRDTSPMGNMRILGEKGRLLRDVVPFSGLRPEEFIMSIAFDGEFRVGGADEEKARAALWMERA